MEGEEQRDLFFTVVDWCDPAKTRRVEVDFQKMKGKYFYGRVKTSDKATKYLPEYLITVIL